MASIAAPPTADSATDELVSATERISLNEIVSTDKPSTSPFKPCAACTISESNVAVGTRTPASAQLSLRRRIGRSTSEVDESHYRSILAWSVHRFWYQGKG